MEQSLESSESYVFANNDNAYSEYEKKLKYILQHKKLNFLSPVGKVGIFDVGVDHGYIYAKTLIEEFPEIIDIIKQHFESFLAFLQIGEQETFFSPELQTVITANTARYLYHALIISKYISNYFLHKFNTQTIDIVEIGGGYGGLCFWLQILNPGLIQKYTIVDLPTANELQQYCCKTLNAPVCTISDPTHIQKEGAPLFVISNYGYSEFNAFYQRLYRDTILTQADGGFMIWNNWTGIFNFTSLPMTIEDERPFFKELYNKFIFF